jgi:hypothetical protein
MPSAASDRTTCPRCGAEIVWTITAKHARMAINADPDPAGNQAVRMDVTRTLRSRAITQDRAQLDGGEWIGMPHAATCTAPPPRLPRRTPRPIRRPGAWRPR